MKTLLCLEDLKSMTEKEIKDHIKYGYLKENQDNTNIDDIKILIAYESVGNWGCDSASWFLFEQNNKLYENYASHCSCCGFEGQWEPEETTIEYLKSNVYFFCAGGYDKNVDENKKLIKDYITNFQLEQTK